MRQWHLTQRCFRCPQRLAAMARAVIASASGMFHTISMTIPLHMAEGLFEHPRPRRSP